jgi:CRP/FNR family transcriptional regulator
MADASSRSVKSLAPFRARPFLNVTGEEDAIRLTERQREELASIGVRTRVRPRAVIYQEAAPADSVFAVTEGVVKSFRELPSGKPVVAAFLFPRDLFGLAEGGRYVNAARAITDVTFYRLPVQELAVLLKHDADLAYSFLAKVTHELREAQRRAFMINRPDAAGRLAMFLVWMAERAERAAGTSVVPLPMTRSDIAAFLGLTLESVSRTARALERDGLVKFDGRHGVRLLDPARLARLIADV